MTNENSEFKKMVTKQDSPTEIWLSEFNRVYTIINNSNEDIIVHGPRGPEVVKYGDTWNLVPDDKITLTNTNNEDKHSNVSEIKSA